MLRNRVLVMNINVLRFQFFEGIENWTKEEEVLFYIQTRKQLFYVFSMWISLFGHNMAA